MVKEKQESMVELKVAEAKQRDVGKCRVRIDIEDLSRWIPEWF